LLMLIRFDKRTLHDILAGTRVVRKSAPSVSVEPESASAPASVPEDERNGNSDQEP